MEGVIPVSQLASTTARRIPLPVQASAISIGAGEEPDIPASILRASCYLEVLIPSLNEAHRLPQTLMRTIQYLEAQPYSSSIVVIDNGSVDQTSDLVARRWSDRVPVRLTGCAQRGKGAAVRRGILTSRAQFVGYMDADLATPIETLDVVVPLLEKFPVVVGSRRIGGAALVKRQPVYRAVSGAVFRVMANRIVPGLTDSQCGFKFFTGDLVRMVARQLHIDGFAFDVELLKAILERGIPIKEIPVAWSDKAGSSLRAVPDGARAAADMFSMVRRGYA